MQEMLLFVVINCLAEDFGDNSSFQGGDFSVVVIFVRLVAAIILFLNAFIYFPSAFSLLLADYKKGWKKLWVQ